MARYQMEDGTVTETNETRKTPEPNSELQTFGRKELSPGTYTLDIDSAVWEAPLTINEQQSTFIEVLNKLRDSKIKKMPDIAIGIGARSFTWPPRETTEPGKIQLRCEWRLASTVRTLVKFICRGIDPHAVRWFYYDYDQSVEQDHHRFFAVHDGKIVMEECSFYSNEPLIFKKRTVEVEPTWHSDEDFEEAFEIYWYRRFYAETMMGQLMVLRPDYPILYHYERPQPRDAVREIQSVTLLKMYRLLWVAIPLLVAISFPFLKDYMVIAALALGTSFLWLCWETRNVGKS